VQICPEKIFRKEKKDILLQNEVECTMCMDCVDVCPKEPPAVEVSWDGNSFVLSVETTGALTAERVIREAFKVLENKTEEFMKELERLGLN